MTTPHTTLSHAVAALAAGRADDAIDAAALILDTPSSARPDLSDTHHLDALVLIGRAFTVKAMYGDALVNLHRAVELDAERADTYCWRGWCYFVQGRDQLAHLDYERALELDGEHAQTYVHRGLLHRAAGDYGFAVADFARAAADDHLALDAIAYRGLCRLDAGDRRGAELDLLTAARRGSTRAAGWLAEHFPVGDTGALIALARHHRLTGHAEVGLGVLARAIAIGFDDEAQRLEALLENGHLHNTARQWSNALEAFDAAFELAPDHRDAEAYRARALYNLERDDEAASALHKALCRYPSDGRLHRFLGELLVATGRCAEAVTAFSAAIAADDADGRSWLLRAWCHTNLGRDDDARRDLLAAERRGEASATGLRISRFGLETGYDFFDAGVAALDAGDASGAVRALDRAVELLGADSRARGDRAYRYRASAMAHKGQALSQLGRHDEAIALLSRAAVMRPTFAAPHTALGGVYRAMGRYEQALTAYTRFVELEPTRPSGFYNRAHIHLLLGDVGTAIADLDVAIELGYREPERLAEALLARARANQAAGRLGAALRDYELLAERGDELAAVYLDNVANLMEHVGSPAAANEFPFRFYGSRPTRWLGGDDDGQHYRLVFATAPDAEARARIAEAFETAAYGRIDTMCGVWRWSGRFAALEVAALAPRERSAHFEAIEDVLCAVHTAWPLDEVVYLDAQAASYGDPWELWSIASRATPTAAPDFGDPAQFWVAAPCDVRELDAIGNDDMFEHARRTARTRRASERAAERAERALAAGDVALVPVGGGAELPSAEPLPAEVIAQLGVADVARVSGGRGLVMRRVGGYHRMAERIDDENRLHPVALPWGELAGPSVRHDGAIGAIGVDCTLYEIDLDTGDVRRVIALDPSDDNRIDCTTYVGTDRIAIQTRTRMILVQRGSGDDGGTVVASRPGGSGFTTAYRDGEILVANAFGPGPNLYIYGVYGDRLVTLAELDTDLNAYTIQVAGDRILARSPAGPLELHNLDAAYTRATR